MPINNPATRRSLGLDTTDSPVFAGIDCGEIYNSGGNLKIMPDVQGDVALFGDTDVANGVDGRVFSINRRAPEGDNYLNLYINDDQVAYIDSNWDISIRSNLASGVIELGAIPTNIVRLIGTVNAVGEPTGTENLPLRHYGYITADSAQRFVTWLLDDTDDYFWLTRSDTNILGFKVDMPLNLVDNNLTTTGNLEGGIIKTDNFQNAAGTESIIWSAGDSWWEIGDDVRIAGNLNADSMTTPYAQVVTVAKSGGDFTTIQGAINSIIDATTTKRYCVKVQSGVYAEAITMKDYVDIQGAGRTNTIISGTSGTVLIFSATHCTVMDVGVNVNYGTLGVASQAIVSSGADSAFIRCDITVTKSAGDKLMKALAVSGGSFRMMECYFAYSITGATTDTALIQAAVSHTGASTIFLLHSNEIVMTCDDTNDELVGFETVDGSVGTWLLENNIITVTASNTATGLWLHGTATGATVGRNRMTISAPVSYGLYIDSDAGGAVVDSRHNEIIISGAGSYSGYVDTGDTWNSTFDKMTSVNGYTGSLGTVNLISSPNTGNFAVTGTTLFSDKVKFTQIDGNEYIDSLNDAYMDYGATTGHRFLIGGTEQVNLIDGVFEPKTTNDIDLGTSSLLWKDIWEIGKHYFRDSAIYSWSSGDGWLNLVADVGVEVNAPVLNVATLYSAGAFGCNGAAVQTAYASGGALAAYVTGAFGLDSAANMSALHALVVKIRAALVANGIMS